MFTKVLCKFTLLLALVCSQTPTQAQVLNLNQVTDAVCRVTVGGGFGAQAMGSGTVISSDSNFYYVLTNYHVVTRNSSVNLEFFRRGVKSGYISGTVIWRAYQENTDVDFAIVKVSKSAFGNYPPRVIPLAPPNFSLANGAYICASGCPNGRWAQSWEGHITGNEGRRVIFLPAPVGGQSGSGIVALYKDSNGNLHSRVSAILTWRLGQGNQSTESGALGGAIPMSTLHSVFNNKKSFQPVSIPKHWQPVSTQPNCRICGQSFYDHIYATDGKFYCPSKNNSVVLPLNVKTVYWNSKQAPEGFYDTQCPPGGCPPNYGYGGEDYGNGVPPNAIPYNGGIFGFRRNPRNPNPSPNPSPGPGGDGSTPPNIPGIGSPWQEPPGNVPIVPPSNAPSPTPQPQPKPELDVPPVLPRPIPESSNKLLKEVEGLSKQIEALIKEKDDANKKVTQLESDLKIAKESGTGIIGSVKKAVSDNPTTSILGLGLVGGLLYWFWIKFGKTIAIKQIDNVEDLLQQKITNKFGTDAGKSARDVMEGVEDVLMNWLDTFLAERKQVNSLSTRVEQVALNRKKEQLREGLGLFQTNNDPEALKKEVLRILEGSRETEVKEKDTTGLALTDKLLAKLATLTNPTVADLQNITSELAEHERKENDVDVLRGIEELSGKLNKLMENNLTNSTMKV